jgi:hypothetical protein
MQTFAYEIAGAFFLAAILMGGSFLRGFIPREILRGFQLAATGLALAGGGLWIYRALSAEPATTPVVNSAPDAARQAQKSKRAASLRESDRKALAAAMADEAAKPDIPTHLLEGQVAAESVPEKRGTKIAKSVGRALHIVPKAEPSTTGR